jgi:hypothetical protein
MRRHPRTGQNRDVDQLVKNRRSLVLSLLLPIILLLVTNTPRAEQRLGGAPLIIGLCVTYGLASTSLMGYAVTVARGRDRDVLQRLRVTPASSWEIMTSRLAVQMLANLIIALVVVIAGCPHPPPVLHRRPVPADPRRVGARRGRSSSASAKPWLASSAPRKP